MTEETAPAPDSVEEATEGQEEKPKRKRGNRTPRKPGFKDWIRVIKSNGTGCENQKVHVVINEATNVCTLVTQAPVKEDGDELESERKQIFKITSYEVVNIPEEEPQAAE